MSDTPKKITMITDEKTKVNLPASGFIMFMPNKPKEVLEQWIPYCRKAGCYPVQGQEADQARADQEAAEAEKQAEKERKGQTHNLSDSDFEVLKIAIKEVFATNDPALLNMDGTPKIGQIRGMVTFDVAAKDVKTAVVDIENGDSE